MRGINVKTDPRESCYVEGISNMEPFSYWIQWSDFCEHGAERNFRNFSRTVKIPDNKCISYRLQ
jgi:hypothetical protein